MFYSVLEIKVKNMNSYLFKGKYGKKTIYLFLILEGLICLYKIFLIFERLDGGYTLENFEGVGRAVKTNSCSNTAFRGFGGPEGAFFIETILDRISHELNLSPLKGKSLIFYETLSNFERLDDQSCLPKSN